MFKIIIIITFYISMALGMSEIITPLPEKISFDRQKAKLGKKLFHDKRFSSDGTISCASCHDLTLAGADNSQFSLGVEGKRGAINAPTVYNAVFNFVQFCDGSAKDLKSQVLGPMHNPIEMDVDMKEMLRLLKHDLVYAKMFKQSYEDGVSVENVQDAIAEFEKTLLTPNSRFDRYLKGDAEILSEEELEGYALFKSYGCIACHNGVNIGGNLYQKLGIMKKYENPVDQLGRFNVSKRERDKHYFKVPSLRNIALSSPYLYNGSITNLYDVIEIMMEYQLGRKAIKEDVIKIESFLLTLTGEKPVLVEDE